MILLPRIPSCWLILSLCTASAVTAETASPTGAPGTKSAVLAEGEPLIKSWVPAEFPSGLPKDTSTGSAVARIIVDETGAIRSARVLEASAPEFGAAALAAVKKWTFSPGVDYGKVVAMCLDVPFRFARGAKPKTKLLPDERDLPRRVTPTKATLEDGPLGEYPPNLVGRGLPGSVIFACDVNREGKASNIRILRASHADFVLPALESSANWKFQPAMEGDLPISAQMEGEVSYDDAKTPPRAKVLAANGITAPDGSEPEFPPLPIAVADPVFPYDQAIDGQDGSASVEFTVGTNGVVRDVHVKEATEPAYGAALLAAVETWVFSPAMARGMGIEVALVKHADFKAVPKDGDANASDPFARVVRLARAKAIGGGRGLDERLTPIYRIAPASPEGAENEKGSATIEFVIDRDGRVRLPRIVSATKDTFGWAAVTAVSQWIFKAPKRGGQPTEVKVQIPIGF